MRRPPTLTKFLFLERGANISCWNCWQRSRVQLGPCEGRLLLPSSCFLKEGPRKLQAAGSGVHLPWNSANKRQNWETCFKSTDIHLHLPSPSATVCFHAMLDQYRWTSPSCCETRTPLHSNWEADERFQGSRVCPWLWPWLCQQRVEERKGGDEQQWFGSVIFFMMTIVEGVR